MSLVLTRGTKPHGVKVKTHGLGNNAVFLGNYEISLEDFLVAAHYVLTNTDLSGDNDPRLQFVKSVGAMKQVDGYNMPDTKRLDTDVSPVPEPTEPVT